MSFLVLPPLDITRLWWRGRRLVGYKLGHSVMAFPSISPLTRTFDKCLLARETLAKKIIDNYLCRRVSKRRLVYGLI